MTLVAHSFVASNTRALALRRRPDLVSTRHVYLGRQYWVVKDPLTLKYFRFEDEEFAILEMLDGVTSLEQIQRRFEKRFAPQKLTYAELHQLVGMLHRSSLVISELPGQGQQLFKRHREHARQERWAMFANILNVRFKGFDPDRILSALDRRLSGLFTTNAFIASVFFMLAALLLVACHFDTFQAKLPTFQQFFAAKNWLYLALTLGATKVIHEFGHGLSCKHFGGECHEMGVMLLVGSPCLYCNVTDSWMLPNKWQRAIIGGAGMYVELMLASAATFLWWFSEPGILNHLCLNVMFVCSVSTLVFNVNPLMRYDGYYILSDLLEIPNLRQKATTILQRRASAVLLGIPETPDPFLPRRNRAAFAAFAVAAAVYRWVVSLSILLFLNKVLEPYGLKVLGQIMAVGSLFGLVIYPLWRLGKFFCNPARMEQVKKNHAIPSAVVIGSTLLAIFFVPLPHRVRCSLVVQPREAAAVYVDVPGNVRQIHVQAGEPIAQGEPLITLESLDLQLALTRLQGERNQRAVKHESLRQRALSGDEDAALEIAPLEESILALDQQIDQRRNDLRRLVVTAPRSGTIFAPPEIAPASRESGLLPTWSGAALHEKNQGAFFNSGVLLCRVGDPAQLEAILAVDQDDIDFVEPGRAVQIFLDELPGQSFLGTINHVAVDDMKTTPLSLSSKAGGGIVTQTDASGRERPVSTTYQASVSFEAPPGIVFSGVTGQAKIYAAPRTISYRLWRAVCHTFNFSM